MSHFTEGCGGTDIPPVGLAESSFCCWRRRHVIPPFSSVGGSCPPFHIFIGGRKLSAFSRDGKRQGQYIKCLLLPPFQNIRYFSFVK
jgi:hypothetical protein